MADLLRSRRAGSSRSGSNARATLAPSLRPLDCEGGARGGGTVLGLTAVTGAGVSLFGEFGRCRFLGGSESSDTRLSSRFGARSDDLGGDTDFLFWAVRSVLVSGAVLVIGGIVRPFEDFVSLLDVSFHIWLVHYQI